MTDLTFTMTFPRETRYTIKGVTRTINLAQVHETLADKHGADDGHARFCDFVHSLFVQGWHIKVDRSAASADDKDAARNAKHKALCAGIDDGRQGIDDYVKALRQVYVANFAGKEADIKSEADLVARCLDRVVSALVVKNKVKADDNKTISAYRKNAKVVARANELFADMKGKAETIMAAAKLDDIDLGDLDV